MKHTNHVSSRCVATLAAMGLCGLALTGCGDDGSDLEDPPERVILSIGAGAFAPLGTYEELRGHAQILRMLEDRSVVEVHVEGLQPGTEYPVYLHAYPCEVDDAGERYKIDPTLLEALSDNEIWAAVTASADGVGQASLTVSHRVRPDAQSVVVLDPDMDDARMACANLTVPSSSGTVVRSGAVVPYAQAEALDRTITGLVQMITDVAGTSLALSVQGLDGEARYEAHIHRYPCSVDDGGGHYKIDPRLVEVVEENEMWPAVSPNESGLSEATYFNNHLARADAQSLVIHRVLADSSPRVACADLERNEYDPLLTQGQASLLPVAEERGYGDLRADVDMQRNLNATTQIQVKIEGLRPDKGYPVRVHDASCALHNGGEQYKMDPDMTDTVADNEIWLDMFSDASGVGRASVTIDHLARPEAQSIVIRDFEDDARLACIQLH